MLENMSHCLLLLKLHLKSLLEFKVSIHQIVVIYNYVI